MELSPQSVSSTTFKIVKKGFDPEQVKSYLANLAAAIEVTQNQASAMEARARAAIARLQELSAATAPAPEPAAPTVAEAAVNHDAENISRTLLLAQRTADATVGEARAEADRIAADAEQQAKALVDGAQEIVNRLVEESKVEARRAGEDQRVQVESEVQSLLARRDFLVGDVEVLEQHIVIQRERLRDVAGALSDIVDKVPGGLAEVRRPLISAVSNEVPVEAHPELAPDVANDAATVADVEALVDAHDGDSAEEAGELDAGQDATLPMLLPEHSDQLVPMVSPKPVVLTPIGADVDPIWVGRTNDADPVLAAPSLLDGLDDTEGLDTITEELPAVRQARRDDLVIGGEELA